MKPNIFQPNKIKGKLLLSFSVVLFLSCVLAGWGYYSINRILEIRNIEENFKNVKMVMLNMRKSEKDFLMRDAANIQFLSTGKSKYATLVSNFVHQEDSLITMLQKSKWSTKLNIKEDLTLLNQTIGEYYVAFDKIVKAYIRRGFKDYGDEGELRRAIHAVEDSKYALDKIRILTLRRHEKDFLLRKDLAYVEKFKEELQALRLELDNSAKNKEIKEKLDIYEAKFLDLVKVDEAIGFTDDNGYINAMRDVVHKFEPIIVKLEKIVEVQTEEITFETQITFAVVFLIELILGIILATQFSKRLTFNILGIREAAVKLSQGIIPPALIISSSDELGDTQRSVNDLISNLKDSVEVANLVSRGNLYSAQEAAKTKLKSGELDNALKNMIKKLTEIAQDITKGAGEITYGSLEISKSSQVVAQGATEQASSLEEISSSVEQMVSNINQNADNSSQAEEMTKEAAEKMKLVREATNSTFKSIRDIGEKIEIINDIADKTNLLAINAAVEAARAGEHGKGFAVVANEVRKLAERSRKSAEDIIELSKITIREAEKSGHLLDELAPDVQKSFNLVQEISSSSAEQRSGAEQINVALTQLNQVTQQNASSSEELASASTNFNNQSAKLKETVSFFKLDKKGEVVYQRDRIIGQIEQLKSMLNETDGQQNEDMISTSNDEVIRTVSKPQSKSSLNVEANEFGGPSIQLDDYDKDFNLADRYIHDNGEKQNGHAGESGKSSK